MKWKKKYEEKFIEEKNNHKKICNKLEDQLKSLINETEFLQKKSGEPLQKINELLETQAALQQQNHDYKENIEKLIKENQKQYKNIILLEKEKSELIQENENINKRLSKICKIWRW